MHSGFECSHVRPLRRVTYLLMQLLCAAGDFKWARGCNF